ncbi:MAG: hypothetical protein ACKVU1_15425 [bacterium]
MANSRRTGASLFIPLFVLAALASGCGANDRRTPCATCPEPEIGLPVTPLELLTSWFERAYSERDSVLYADALDSAFTFEFLPEDADSAWDAASELRSSGAMFRDEDVTGITVNILVNSNEPYSASDCVGCRQLETTVTLRVATIGDGVEPLIYTVDSPQTFITKFYAADSRWTVFRQIDVASLRSQRDGMDPPLVASAPTTEPGTWGQIKLLFSP